MFESNIDSEEEIKKVLELYLNTNVETKSIEKLFVFLRLIPILKEAAVGRFDDNICFIYETLIEFLSNFPDKEHYRKCLLIMSSASFLKGDLVKSKMLLNQLIVNVRYEDKILSQNKSNELNNLSNIPVLM